MKNFGLIGFPLSHSFSPAYFENKFKRENINANYKAYPIENIERYCELIENISFSGLNVTIPYKEKILSFLDEIDEVAKKIGAVNTIKFYKGKSKGYNTDVFGFEVSIMELIENPEIIKGALVLGSGGASHAVCFILDKLNIPHQIVSRNDKRYLSYEDISEKVCSNINLIINTTPLGMSPNEDKRPELSYHWEAIDGQIHDEARLDQLLLEVRAGFGFVFHHKNFHRSLHQSLAIDRPFSVAFKGRLPRLRKCNPQVSKMLVW